MSYDAGLAKAEAEVERLLLEVARLRAIETAAFAVCSWEMSTAKIGYPDTMVALVDALAVVEEPYMPTNEVAQLRESITEALAALEEDVGSLDIVPVVRGVGILQAALEAQR